MNQNVLKFLKSPAAALKGNYIRDGWDLVSGLPGGHKLYSAFISRLVPYTGTIGSTVRSLRAGHCVVEMHDRRAVRNHLESVHAIALVNLAELCGNLAVAYSLPDDGRFIVSGLEIRYLKKARGLIRATCNIEAPTSSDRQEIRVPVILRNEQEDVVAEATLLTLVGSKKRAE